MAKQAQESPTQPLILLPPHTPQPIVLQLLPQTDLVLTEGITLLLSWLH